MACNNDLGAQRFNLLDCPQPFLPFLGCVGLSKILMEITIDGVPCHNQAEIGHIHNGRVVCVGMSDLEDIERTPIDMELIGCQWRCQLHRRRNLVPREELEPGIIPPLRFQLLLHVRDGAFCSNCSSAGPFLSNSPNTEEVVAMTVCDIDVFERLIGDSLPRPLYEVIRLARGNWSVNENSFRWAMDQGACDR